MFPQLGNKDKHLKAAGYLEFEKKIQRNLKVVQDLFVGVWEMGLRLWLLLEAFTEIQ